MTIDPKALFALKKPCHNCPFRKTGGIELAPGRLKGIIAHLLTDDWNSFECHKTVHNARTGGDWIENDEGESAYQRSGKESMCAGAIIYLEKVGQPSVPMRIAAAMGYYDPEVLKPFYGEVIDPIKDVGNE